MTTSGRVSAPHRPSEQIANTANERLEPRHLDAAIVISIPSGETIGLDSGQVKLANLGVQYVRSDSVGFMASQGNAYLIVYGIAATVL